MKFPWATHLVIHLETRLVEIAGIVHRPHGVWVKQVFRNLTDAIDGFLLGKTYILMDRDPVFTKDARQLLRNAGVRPVRLPAKSPNLKGYASHCTSCERFGWLWEIRPRFASLRPCALVGG